MLSFASAPGNLFNRLGKLGLLVKNTYAAQQTLLTSMTNTTTGVVAQYNAESDIQAFMGSAYIGILSGIEGACVTGQSIATATINRMVFRDNPRISQNLTTLNVIASINEVIRQMNIANATVLAMVVASSQTAFVGNGNGVIVTSVYRPSDGRLLENSFAETILFTCSEDSYSGGATVGNEGFTVTGSGSETDPFAFDWPLGSNSQTVGDAINGDASNQSGNLLVNSGFITYNTTPNIPDNWQLQVGAAGVNVFQENSITYSATSNLRIDGDGTTNVTLIQQFGSGSGTSNTLSVQTQYAFNIFLRRGGALSTGTLTISLVDGSFNTLPDASGSLTVNVFNINLASLTTNFVAFNVAFRTPAILPTVAYIKYELTVPLNGGASIYLARSGFGLMNQQYVSGPFNAIFSGSVPFIDGDYATSVITNSKGAGGTLSTFQILFNQFYGMQQNDILLPSSPTPTILDSLIG